MKTFEEVYEVLNFMDNNLIEIDFYAEDGEIKFHWNLNDFFSHGADHEEITLADLSGIKKAINDVYAADKSTREKGTLGRLGMDLYVTRKRKQKIWKMERSPWPVSGLFYAAYDHKGFRLGPPSVEIGIKDEPTRNI